MVRETIDAVCWLIYCMAEWGFVVCCSSQSHCDWKRWSAEKCFANHMIKSFCWWRLRCAISGSLRNNPVLCGGCPFSGMSRKFRTQKWRARLTIAQTLSSHPYGTWRLACETMTSSIVHIAVDWSRRWIETVSQIVDHVPSLSYLAQKRRIYI